MLVNAARHTLSNRADERGAPARDVFSTGGARFAPLAEPAPKERQVVDGGMRHAHYHTALRSE